MQPKSDESLNLLCEEFVNCTDSFRIVHLLRNYAKYFGKITRDSLCESRRCDPVISSSPYTSWRDGNVMKKRKLKNKYFSSTFV